MSLTDILVTMLMSASVSALVTWLLKMSFQHLLDRHLQLEIERVKSSLAMESDRLKAAIELETTRQTDLARKRLEVYPAIIELAYRIRNMARDSLSGAVGADVAKAFAGRVLELEEALYRNRYYLDSDDATGVVHDFKNCAVTFNILFGDIAYLNHNGEKDAAQTRKADAHRVYRILDELQTRLNRRVMSVMSGPGASQVFGATKR
ncbi:MAG: hypothetical protein FJ279_01340 [Planctomycetes bacterium]|nr:hypothetical protein [Planctomycetota bacterium]